MYALGGEYRSLVGSVNPFVTKQQQQRAEAAGTSVDTGAAPPRRLAESAQHLTPPSPPSNHPLPSASNNNNNNNLGEQKSTSAAASVGGAVAATTSLEETNKIQQGDMLQKHDNHVEDEVEEDGYLESREGAAILTDEEDLSEMDIEEMIDVLDPDNHHSVRRMISTSADADNGLIHEDDHRQVEAAMRSNLPPPQASNDNKNKNESDDDNNKPKPPSV